MMKNTVSNTWSKPLEVPKSIPSDADVVIIGGGIVGVSTAWFLAKQGIKVVLCEKGHIAGEQSGRNWGWVRQQDRDVRELPMIIESMKIWQTLSDEIGEDVGFTQTGCIYAAETEKQLESYAKWLPTAKAYGLDTTLLSSSEMDDHIQNSGVAWKGGLSTPSDGRAEPHLAAPAIARAAERASATILTSCAVRGLETKAGRVSGVVTEHGTINAPQVLCAGGAWTSMFCRSVGIDLPQLSVRCTVVRTPPVEQVFNGELLGAGLGIRRRQDGGYSIANDAHIEHSITPTTLRYALKFLPALIHDFSMMRLSIGADFLNELRTPKKWRLDQPSPFENNRVLDPAPTPRALNAINKGFARLFPTLAPTQIAEAWAGMIETTPDVIPVIEETKKIPGFHIATGFSGHGFGIGPGAGKAIAGMLSGKDTGIDLSEFKLKRFYDGSKMTLYKKI
ncbi:MAG: FAD-binding oxidoreductase [Emcibacteraceae bacterium]|nr:FAD-binding oxidoreductase [Emcibacteraceae bacterium]MDG1858230.1 FAD-binding oxidoreductase [Emcibacteraceae bacterium]